MKVVAEVVEVIIIAQKKMGDSDVCNKDGDNYVIIRYARK